MAPTDPDDSKDRHSSPAAGNNASNPFSAFNNFIESQVSSLFRPFLDDLPPPVASMLSLSHPRRRGDSEMTPSENDWIVSYVLFSAYSPVHLSRSSSETPSNIPPILESIMEWSKLGPKEEVHDPNMPNWHDAFDDLIRITNGLNAYPWEKLTPRDRSYYRDYHQIPMIYLWSMAHRGSLGAEWKRAASADDDDDDGVMDRRFLPRMGQVLQENLQRSLQQAFDLDSRQPENDRDEDDVLASAIADARSAFSPILGMMSNLGLAWPHDGSQNTAATQKDVVWRTGTTAHSSTDSYYQEDADNHADCKDSESFPACLSDRTSFTTFLLNNPYSPLLQSTSRSFFSMRSVDEDGEVKSWSQNNSTPNYADAFEDLVRLATGKEMLDRTSQPSQLAWTPFNWRSYMMGLISRRSISFESSQDETEPKQTPSEAATTQTQSTREPDTELDHYTHFLHASNSHQPTSPVRLSPFLTSPAEPLNPQYYHNPPPPNPPTTKAPAPESSSMPDSSNPIVSTNTTTHRTTLPDSSTETRITLRKTFKDGTAQSREIRRVTDVKGNVIFEEVWEGNDSAGNDGKGKGGWFWR